MAQTANPGPLLIPSPRALQKALQQSAQQAQRLAQAFGKVVSAEKRNPAIRTSGAERAIPSTH